MHDDQHGTAIVVLAALKGAARVLERDLSRPGRSSSPAPAPPCIACANILLACGISDVVVLDSKGIVSTDRTDLNEFQGRHGRAQQSARPHRRCRRGSQRCRRLLGRVRGNHPEVHRVDERRCDRFRDVNPDREDHPEVAAKYAAVVATGRSDFPNRINNVLAFPGVFAGALDAGARRITENMKIAAAEANPVGGLDKLSRDYIVPSPLDDRVAPAVAAAVAAAAAPTASRRRDLPVARLVVGVFSSCGDAARPCASPNRRQVVSALLIPAGPRSGVTTARHQLSARGHRQRLQPASRGVTRVQPVGCRNKANHPVILLHGTSMNQLANFRTWRRYSPTPVLRLQPHLRTDEVGQQYRRSGPTGDLRPRWPGSSTSGRGDWRAEGRFHRHSQGGSSQLTSQLRTSRSKSTIVGLSAPSRGLLVGSIRTAYRPPASRARTGGGRGISRSLRQPGHPLYDASLDALPGNADAPGPSITNIVIRDVLRLRASATPGCLTRARSPRWCVTRSTRHRVAVPCGGPSSPLATRFGPAAPSDTSFSLPSAARRPSSVGRAIHS